MYLMIRQDSQLTPGCARLFYQHCPGLVVPTVPELQQKVHVLLRLTLQSCRLQSRYPGWRQTCPIASRLRMRRQGWHDVNI